MFERSNILQQLEQAKAGENPAFAVAFALDNNPSAIVENMRNAGYIVNEPTDAFRIIMDLAQTGYVEQCESLLNVPYLNEAPNYTGGFRDWFLQNSSMTPQMRAQGVNDTRGAINWGGLLAALGAGLGAYASTIVPGTGNALTADQRAALEAEAARKAAEEEKAKKQRMYWIIGGSVLGLILLVAIIYAVKKSNKNA